MGTTAAGSRVEAVDERPASREDRAWIWRVLALVVVFGVITALRSVQVGIPFRDPGGSLFRGKLAGAVLILLLFVMVDIGARWFRSRADGRSLWQVARTRWTPYRTGMIAAGLVAYSVVYLCYRNLKSWDVFLTPRDDLLLRWDHWLFLGHTPAVLLHDVLGQDVAARVLSALYESFATVLTLALLAALAFAPTVRSSFVFVVSAMWAWILGVGSYYLIPSLGPFHAVPSAFAGLTRTSIQQTQGTYVAQRDHLLAHPHASDAFAQISAFASLHCAMTCLIWLMARYYGLRRLSWVAFAFFCCTVVATIYLGWHFAVDDIAGIGIAWVSVQLGKLTVLGHRRNPAAASMTA
jgi:PAP2 superfamily